MTRTSDTIDTHLQRCQTLGEGSLKLCAHQCPYTQDSPLTPHPLYAYPLNFLHTCRCHHRAIGDAAARAVMIMISLLLHLSRGRSGHFWVCTPYRAREGMRMGKKGWLARSVRDNKIENSRDGGYTAKM